MSINFKELSEFIKEASSAGVKSFSIDGSKVTVEFSASLPVLQDKIPADQAGGVEVSPKLAERIKEIHEHEKELNLMIENPDQYEEELARLEEHEVEDIPADGEGDQ